MKNLGSAIVFAFLLLIPAYVGAQSTPQRITLYENFDELEKGESFFIFGRLANVLPDAYLILEIINPNGDLCQIQQLSPLSNGLFVTEAIPMKGRICGPTGQYEVKVFYGDYSVEQTFSVVEQSHQEKDTQQYYDQARLVISEKLQALNKTGGSVGKIEPYSQRLDSVSGQASDESILELEQIYVDLWDTTFIETDFYDLDVNFRPAFQGALDATAELIEAGDLSMDVAKDIDQETFAAIFYSKIGDSKNAIAKLNDVFVLIKNVDPTKVQQKQATLSFGELEEALLNLMKKTHSVMSKPVKEEVAFIFARGTGPLYADEVNQLIDLLSKSRYLDVILRKDSSLYSKVQAEWTGTKPTLMKKDTIEELLESKEKIDRIHQATLLLRSLDNVDRFISSDEAENSELANLIQPRWSSLQSSLVSSSSVDNIIDLHQDIENMKRVIDASSRISKAVEISQKSNLNAEIVSGWQALLLQVDTANSVEEILDIVSEFDQSITELREKRNPISILRFEYEAMKAKAEMQADHKNLFVIDNALKILDTAQKMEQKQQMLNQQKTHLPTGPSITKIDRIEVLLTWASAKAPEIQAELASYNKDAYKVRASDILQRAKSIENLVDLSLRKNKFLPGYLDFADSMKNTINDARDLVIQNDLDSADNIVRQTFVDWQQVSGAYAKDPYGSEIGYSVDELKRIEYRDKVQTFSKMVTNFYNSDFEPYSGDYLTMSEDVLDMIEYGNFVDAQTKLEQMGKYLSEKLALKDQKIIYQIEYDQERNIWIISGAVDKPVMDRREDLYVTVYNMDGTVHSKLEFTDTRQGEFYTQWEAPADPGLYVVMLQYQNSKASQIVFVKEKSDYGSSIPPEKMYYSEKERDIVELSREFAELREFIDEFGQTNLQKHDSRFSGVTDQIKAGLAERDIKEVEKSLEELKELIERYLPVRSRSAIIETEIKEGQLYISGAVQKTLSFSEDLFVDIYDQHGDHVDEIALKDSSSGHFNDMVNMALEPGMYVAQLQYHDMVVSDFFTING